MGGGGGVRKGPGGGERGRAHGALAAAARVLQQGLHWGARRATHQILRLPHLRMLAARRFCSSRLGALTILAALAGEKRG